MPPARTHFPLLLPGFSHFPLGTTFEYSDFFRFSRWMAILNIAKTVVQDSFETSDTYDTSSVKADLLRDRKLLGQALASSKLCPCFSLFQFTFHYQLLSDDVDRTIADGHTV